MRAIVSPVDPCGVAFHVAIESGAHLDVFSHGIVVISVQRKTPTYSELDVIANLPLSSNVPSVCRQGHVQ